MFSSKSEALVSHLLNARDYAGLTTKAFRPQHDTRTELGVISTRSGRSFPAMAVVQAPDILAEVPTGVRVVGIDEAQFFDFTIIAVVETLVAKGVDVMVAGLDTNFLGEPFNFVPHLLALADERINAYAVCNAQAGKGNVCGGRAVRTQLLSPQVSADPNAPESIGDKDKYAARCRDHFVPPTVHR
jgi:thymidine kinase